jgi:hypothetical protein
MRLALCFIATIALSFSSLASVSHAKRKGPRKIKKIFTSKARFGRSAKSKRRGKWRRIIRVKAPSATMAQVLGKHIDVMCQLSKSSLFTCEFRTSKGTTYGTESTKWPKGRMRLLVQVTPESMSLELANKWKRHVRGKRKRIK